VARTRCSPGARSLPLKGVVRPRGGGRWLRRSSQGVEGPLSAVQGASPRGRQGRGAGRRGG
jgi:hypothetical protein